MNKQTAKSNRSVLLRLIKATFAAGALPVLVLVFSLQTSHAGSATWRANAATNDWHTAANWTPATVPNGSGDIATFATSSQTSLSIASSGVELNNLVFSVGANAYTINIAEFWYLQLSGVGVTNNSGITQQVVFTPTASNNTQLAVINNATAGDAVTYAMSTGAYGEFFNNATAGNATFLLNDYSHVTFWDSSTAGAATFELSGSDSFGAAAYFFRDSTAGNATFTLGGNGAFCAAIFYEAGTSAGSAVFTVNGSGPDSNGASFIAFNSGSADQATLIANPQITGGFYGGGVIYLTSDSSGGTARIELFGSGRGDAADGTLDITGHVSPGVAVGSIEGNGLVRLGPTTLTVGGSNIDTTFAGVIEDGIPHGSLTKVGTGTFTLSGANTYSGSTTITAGALEVANRRGSATGSGPVGINAGTLAGRGIISGAVTVGSGSGVGAALEPSLGSSKPTKLTIKNAIVFKPDSTYTYKVNTSTAKGDTVAVNGATIASGAQFICAAVANKRLLSGTVFTAISNTSALPINGTFTNLADGSILIAGRNKYQVSYEGGDGNDLTLTVVP